MAIGFCVATDAVSVSEVNKLAARSCKRERGTRRYRISLARSDHETRARDSAARYGVRFPLGIDRIYGCKLLT